MDEELEIKAAKAFAWMMAAMMIMLTGVFLTPKISWYGVIMAYGGAIFFVITTKDSHYADEYFKIKKQEKISRSADAVTMNVKEICYDNNIKDDEATL